MKIRQTISRRSFLAVAGAVPFLAALRVGKQIPVGLELYSVRDDLKKDLTGTVDQVAHLGYECVEFFSPYYQWTLEYAQKVRKQLDSLRVRCYSTHNDLVAFQPDGINKAIELNQALGARYLVCPNPGEPKTVDDWKRVAETLNAGNQTLAKHGMHAGYHNHEPEWKPVNGQKPMEILAVNTDKSIALQLDVGTCVAAGSDPVQWVESNPGRIRSMHLKDWSPEKGYRVLFGEGVTPWKKLFAAAESTGGAEYYLIEQEGSDYSEIETAKRCLAAYRQMRA